ncbi:MAG: hypothetical protein F6K24_48565 [Okeania sp. SIO2D1]|uniref:hypothetical protein n=1 Tax=Okeania sp. SIO2C9 TaxID=2607791 RepID=UPI0013BBC772|nr:hypothetical protein [Okeania sp. SIO2C9]NEQ73981.1 hypothetical protein [Okeania sp. SIO2C9]NES72501.1 hypothetical protein [Okeania sp. SIO2D1]
MAIFKDDHEHEHQHIYGGVQPNGDCWFGEGFKSQKIKEGTYIVKFENPFAKLPAPVCTISGNEWMTFNMSVATVQITPEYFICITSSPHQPMDCAFTFIAFGDAK